MRMLDCKNSMTVLWIGCWEMDRKEDVLYVGQISRSDIVFVEDLLEYLFMICRLFL